MKNYAVIAILLVLTGCMPSYYPLGTHMQNPQLTPTVYLAADGLSLPLRSWMPKSGQLKAVLLALHGFNDYSNFFAAPAQYLSEHGVGCFAYDQRGFGAAPLRGFWAGSETYVHDVAVFVDLLQQRYPGVPVYVLGESMGGAIAMRAASELMPAQIAGVILSAPAVWSRATMPWYQTSLLWTLAHTVPWLTLTGKGLGKQASDNIEMLRAMGKDPWVIKETRIEAMYGLTNLMDEAFDSAAALQTNTLLMYGEKDEIIPQEPVYQFMQQFLASPSPQGKTVGVYSQGYHLLLRDLAAQTVWQDIVAWIGAHTPQLPSGAHQRAQEILAGRS